MSTAASVEESPAAVQEALPAAPSARRPLLLLLLVAACLGGVYLTPLRHYLSGDGVARLREQVAAMGHGAPLAFLAAASVGIAVGVPRLLFAALGGAVFGWLAGSCLAQLATMLGCLATFAVGRTLARDWVGREVPRRFPRAGALLEMIGRHGIAANVLIRAAPVGNCLAVNLLMAVSPIHLGHFVVGTLLGTLPETVIYGLLGSAAGGQFASRVLGGVALLALLAVLNGTANRRAREARKRNQQTTGGTP